ncbi:hypothetical protein CN311_07065 [Mesorhizobium sanjuanii]|uniref:Uncharacterized protein n=1 Tax=Mesorhizobium sanjuanii TaxID=2037900 RepID=A0A2A6FIM9_9HYPH|nr:hypothetical protein CN311_07065 [Mesorhizobium sanjuanii]
MVGGGPRDLKAISPRAANILLHNIYGSPGPSAASVRLPKLTLRPQRWPTAGSMTKRLSLAVEGLLKEAKRDSLLRTARIASATEAGQSNKW